MREEYDFTESVRNPCAKHLRKRNTVLLIGACLLALALYPVVRDKWDRHRLTVQMRCLKDVYTTLVDANTKTESKGQALAWPRTLSEVLDETTIVKLKQNGIDWRQIQYHPISDDTSESSVVMSLESGRHIIKITRGGAVFFGRKKHEKANVKPRP